MRNVSGVMVDGIQLTSGRKVEKCLREVATLPAAIVVTTRVKGGLKMLLVVGETI